MMYVDGKKKKILAISCVLILLVLMTSGCGGKGEERVYVPKKSREDSFTASEWMNYDEATWETTIRINNTDVVSITAILAFQDSDSAHEQTDKDSEPDTLKLTLKGGSYKESKEGTTSGNSKATIELKIGGNRTEGEGGEYLPTEWTVTITGMTFGGGKNPTGPGGIIPIPFLIYIDQGAAWTLEVKWTYLE